MRTHCVLIIPYIRRVPEGKKISLLLQNILQNILYFKQIDTPLKTSRLNTPILHFLPNSISSQTIHSNHAPKTYDRHEIVLSSCVSSVEFLNNEIVVSGDDSGKTRFWNIKDGTEAQASVAGGKFTFSKGASTKQEVGRHVITADGDLVFVHDIKNAKGSKDVKDAMPVAFFRAPAQIKVLDCAGDNIAVGCASGDVLHLRAAFLAT